MSVGRFEWEMYFWMELPKEWAVSNEHHMLDISVGFI